MREPADGYDPLSLYKLIFDASPHPYLILLPDEQFTIIEANDGYLSATDTDRGTIIGQSIFEAFPDDPDDYPMSGTSDLKASLRRVLANRQSDAMGVQKYNIRNRDGRFIDKYWCPINAPVLNHDREIVAIIHHVEDITDLVGWKEYKNREIAEEVRRAEIPLTAEILKRTLEVKEANRSLKVALADIESEHGRLEKAYEENRMLIRELQHRMRNTLTQIQSIVRLERNTAGYSSVGEALHDLEGRIAAFAELYSLLFISGEVEKVGLDAYLGTIASTLINSASGRSGCVKLRLDLEPITVSARHASAYGLILNELLTNTLKYAFNDGGCGEVAMRLKRHGAHIRLEVADDGAPLPLDFDPRRTRGLGLNLVENLARQLGGEFHWSQEEQKIFSLHIPHEGAPPIHPREPKL